MKIVNFLILVTLTFGLSQNSNLAVLSSEEIFTNPYYSVPKLSPNGKLVIGRIDDGERRELVVTDLESNKRFQVVFFAKRNFLKEFYWIDNDSIYIEYVRGKKAEKSIVQLDLDNLNNKQSPKQVMSEGYLLNSLPELSDKVLFVRQEEKSHEIYTISTQDLLASDFTKATRFSNELDDSVLYTFDEESKSYIAFKFDKRERISVWFLKEPKSSWKLLFEEDDSGEKFRVIQYISESRFLVLTDRETERVSVAIFDVDTQNIESILYENSKFDVTDAGFNDETQHLSYVTYWEHETPRTEYFDVEESQRIGQMLLESEDEDPVYEVDKSLDNSKSILLAYGSSHPGTYIFFDEETNETKLIEHSYPKLIEHEFAKTRKLNITTEDNNNFSAYLTLPYQNKNGVLLVWPQSNYGEDDFLGEFSKSTQFFANRGYSVLRLNVRSPVSSNINNNGKLSFDFQQQIELKQAVSKVLNEYEFNQICSIGIGFNASSAINLTTHSSKNYDCAIGLFGIYDFHLLFNADSFFAVDLTDDGTKRQLQNQYDNFQNFSPIYNAEKIKTPLLLIAGNQDKFSDREQINRFTYVLESRNKDFETLIYSKLGHGVTTWFGEQQLHAAIDDFMRRKLSLPPLEEISNPKEAAREYLKISDIFDFDTLIKNNKKKSYDYVFRAAQLGNPRAMFNYGSYFHRGEFVDEDINEAISWYQKSADAGYSSAAYRLGLLYESHPDLDSNLMKSFKYFEQAKELGFDARAGLKMAKSLCSGVLVKRNENMCRELLDLDALKFKNLKNKTKLVTKDSEQMLLEILPNLILSHENSDELNHFYKNLIIQRLAIEHTDVRIKVTGEGTYEDIVIKGSMKRTKPIPLESGLLFGTQFSVIPKKYSDGKKAVLVRVQRTSDNEKDLTVWQSIYHGKKDKWFVNYRLDESNLIPAIYKMEIFNLDRELLYSSSFNVGGYSKQTGP